ncbi:MAG: four helix bundle protein [bacterium]
MSFSCIYLPPESKVTTLGKVLSKLDVLKFFCQLAWESRLIPTDKYTELSEKLEEIGKMLGGWHRGLLVKLSPQSGERNNSFGTTTR